MSTRYKTQFWQKLYRLQGIYDVFSLSRCHHQDQASNKSIKEASQNSWPLWKSQMSRRKECSLPTAFILPNRWHYRAESLGRDHKMFMLIVSVNNIQIFKRLEYSLSLKIIIYSFNFGLKMIPKVAFVYFIFESRFN